MWAIPPGQHLDAVLPSACSKESTSVPGSVVKELEEDDEGATAATASLLQDLSGMESTISRIPSKTCAQAETAEHDLEHCQNCANKMGEGEKFCKKCGLKRPTDIISSDKCKECGNTYMRDSKFCRKCGTKRSHCDVAAAEVQAQNSTSAARMGMQRNKEFSLHPERAAPLGMELSKQIQKQSEDLMDHMDYINAEHSRKLEGLTERLVMQLREMIVDELSKASKGPAGVACKVGLAARGSFTAVRGRPTSPPPERLVSGTTEQYQSQGRTPCNAQQPTPASSSRDDGLKTPPAASNAVCCSTWSEPSDENQPSPVVGKGRKREASPGKVRRSTRSSRTHTASSDSLGVIGRMSLALQETGRSIWDHCAYSKQERAVQRLLALSEEPLTSGVVADSPRGGGAEGASWASSCSREPSKEATLSKERLASTETLHESPAGFATYSEGTQQNCSTTAGRSSARSHSGSLAEGGFGMAKSPSNGSSRSRSRSVSAASPAREEKPRGVNVRFDKFRESVGGDSESDKPKDLGIFALPAAQWLLHEEEFDDTPSQAFFRKVVYNSKFEIFFGMAIISNAIFMGIEVDYTARAPLEPIPGQFTMVGYGYTAMFFVELVMKMYVDRTTFLITNFKQLMWNILDFFIVVSSCVEVVLDVVAYIEEQRAEEDDSGGGGVNMSNLRIIRIIRVARLMRLFRIGRIVKFIRALRTLVYSILCTLKSVIWSMFLLLIIVYVFGIIFAQAVSDFAIEQAVNGRELSSLEMQEKLYYHWGSLADAMLSLFMSISGGVSWLDVMRPLREVDGFWMTVFLCFITFTYFAVLNVVTGIFCQSAIESAQHDQEAMVQAFVQNRKLYSTRFEKIFKDMDADNSGFITKEEFANHIGNPKVQAYFETLEIDPRDAIHLFQLIDADATDKGIDIEDFVMGCLRLKGMAKSCDIARLMYENKVIMRELGEVMAYLEDHFYMLLGDAARSADEYFQGSAVHRPVNARDSITQ
eukprot:TRINITY_DN121986_c0_g1_i1.p1 TRINITY_DN121986_c0_g1~~TRINITY_DN121986_c0_g1_i1.p1  ORF type:complete len:988 (+),score=247.48 TRINITY_DN121986_c0_g1_i1:172-3135(+)